VTTEAPVSPVSIDPQTAQLQRIWIECLRSVLGQVAGFPVTVEAAGEDETAAAEPAPDKPPACMIISASKALQGDMAILVPEAGALALAQILVSEQLNAAVPFDQDRRDAFEELLRQVLGQVATHLKQAAGGEVEVKPSGSEIPQWTEAIRLGIRIAAENLSPIQVTLIVSPELAKSISAPPEAKQPAAKEAAAPAASSAGPAAAASAGPAAPNAAPPGELLGARNANLELLLDVKLDATIRFGQKQMLLREILELHPGTAVALDREVQEPVELLVGGRVVAQGDVVIVDGNYGLRITEILSPQQRIASLGKKI
jgi:flagellar motor switch protein FliN/FliY